MKKLILTLAIGIFFVAFGNAQTTVSVAKKAVKKEYTVKGNDAVTGYQCPMDCEKGKIYKDKGECPKCGMELKAITKGSARSCSGKKAKGCCAGKKGKSSCAGKPKSSCAGKPKVPCSAKNN